MLDTLTAPRDEADLNTGAGCRPDPGGFLLEARTRATEAAGHMKDLAERFADRRHLAPAQRIAQQPDRQTHLGRHRRPRLPARP